MASCLESQVLFIKNLGYEGKCKIKNLGDGSWQALYFLCQPAIIAIIQKALQTEKENSPLNNDTTMNNVPMNDTTSAPVPGHVKKPAQQRKKEK